MSQGFFVKEVMVMKVKTNFKTTTILLAVALVLFGVLYASQRTGWLKDRLVWETDKENTMLEVGSLKAKVEDHKTNAERLVGLAKGYEQKAIGLEDKLAREKKEQEKRQEQIITMTAQQIVDETRRVLNVDETEVWANELGLQFTLSGSQENLKVLYSAEYAWLKVIPDLSIQVNTYKKGLNTMFNAFKEEKIALNISHNIVVVKLEKQIDKDVKFIKKLQRQFTLVRWKNLAIGVGITIVVFKLVEILK